MKILFIPHGDAFLSHFIPLLNLSLTIDGDVECAFFLNDGFKKIYKKFYHDKYKLKILNTNNDLTISAELSAYSEYKPDIVVDDTNMVTGYVRQVRSVPRVTIIRTGIFNCTKTRNVHHTHSMSGTIESLPDVSFLGFTKKKFLSDFFCAERKIIPGIKSIELVNNELENDQNYYYSGPLILNDNKNFINNSLKKFFNENEKNKKVYITYGELELRDSPREIVECIKYMLKKGIAVITNSSLSRSLLSTFPNSFYQNKYLPMHYICSNVDIIFHHCGSAAYHYPILHNKFSVTLGTQKFDREEVANQLEKLGVSKHIPSPLENPNFNQSFRETVDKYLLNNDYDATFVKNKLEKINTEIENTISEFDFMSILNSLEPISKRSGPMLKNRSGPELNSNKRQAVAQNQLTSGN